MHPLQYISSLRSSTPWSAPFYPHPDPIVHKHGLPTSTERCRQGSTVRVGAVLVPRPALNAVLCSTPRAGPGTDQTNSLALYRALPRLRSVTESLHFHPSRFPPKIRPSVTKHPRETAACTISEHTIPLTPFSSSTSRPQRSATAGRAPPHQRLPLPQSPRAPPCPAAPSHRSSDKQVVR